MADKYHLGNELNNFSTTLAAAVGSGDGSMTLTDIGALATPTGGKRLLLTIARASDPTDVEIVNVAAVAGSVVSMDREQEGTTAKGWNAGDIVQARPTAGMLNALQTAADELESQKLGKSGDTVTTLSKVTDVTTNSVLDWGACMVFVRNISGNTTFTFDNVPIAGSTERVLHLLNTGTNTLTFDNPNAKWVGNEAPTEFGIVDRIVMRQYEGDSNIYLEHSLILPSLEIVTQFSMIGADGHSLVLLANGGAVGAGDNDFGQLYGVVGADTQVFDYVFFSNNGLLGQYSDGKVLGLGYSGNGEMSELTALGANVTQIRGGGEQTVVLHDDGTVSVFGGDTWGQVSGKPAITTATEVASGYGFCAALLADGTVVAWGDDTYGQVTGVGSLTNVASISAAPGGYFGVAVHNDGTVTSWGRDNYSQATQANALTNVDRVVCGTDWGVALHLDGTTTGFGRNTASQVTGSTGLTSVVDIAAGHDHGLAVHGDGTVTGFGTDDKGQTAGAASYTNAAKAAAGYDLSAIIDTDGHLTQFGDDFYLTLAIGQMGAARQVANGEYYSLVLMADGTVTAFGDDDNGLITGAASLSNVTQVSGGVMHAIALHADGTVTAWGYDSSGSVTGPNGAGITDAVQVDAGNGAYHTLVLLGDGTVSAYGEDWAGQVTGATGLTSVVQVASGYEFSFALHADGSVSAWGEDSYNCVSGAAGLSDVVQIDAGQTFGLALHSDGTVTGWGDNSGGALTGLDALSDVVQIACGDYLTMCLHSDGSITAQGTSSYQEVAHLNTLVGVATEQP